jgi:hypothetical protein
MGEARTFDTDYRHDRRNEEAGHTPGPWIAAPYSSVVGAPVVAQSGRPVASVTYFALSEDFGNHDRESEANARLIAAAPDLLAALQDTVALIRGDISGPAQRDGILREAEAAIAKAESPSNV